MKRMAPEPSLSAWRVSDTVAYDVMRETAHTVQAHLLERVDQADDTAVRAEIRAIRRRTLAVDGYDRAAIDTHTAALQERLRELTAPAL
tara:strand:- start:407 stop:673 length:267 start_codon:yes stop_codon:yes gene_type:complete